jgi:O-antigen ligase
VQLIESGVPTVLEVKHSGLRRRWDIVQFEIWNAVDGGNPSGHSLVQRFLFLKNAFRVFQDQPALGVGTGDVPAAIAASYDEANSPLAPEFRLRPHNQYITFLISGGPLSMLLWMAILVALVAVSGNAFPTYPFQVACLAVFIIALSCMTEDTLETQAGVTLAGFLIGLIGKRTIH